MESSSPFSNVKNSLFCHITKIMRQPGQPALKTQELGIGNWELGGAARFFMYLMVPLIRNTLLF